MEANAEQMMNVDPGMHVAGMLGICQGGGPIDV